MGYGAIRLSHAGWVIGVQGAGTVGKGAKCEVGKKLSVRMNKANWSFALERGTQRDFEGTRRIEE